MSKRIISLILVIALTISLTPVSVRAAEVTDTGDYLSYDYIETCTVNVHSSDLVTNGLYHFVEQNGYDDYVTALVDDRGFDVQHMVFAYHDLNNDGTEELIIDVTNSMGWGTDIIFGCDPANGKVDFWGAAYTYNYIQYSAAESSIKYQYTNDGSTATFCISSSGISNLQMGSSGGDFISLTWMDQDEVLEELYADENTNSSVPAWAQAYYDFIVSDRNDETEHSDSEWRFVDYELLYLDDDSIPEIWIRYETTAEGCRLLSYSENQLLEELFSYDELYFVPKSGVVRVMGGRMGVYHDIIYRLNDAKLEELARGNYYEEVQSGNITYTYEWDGVVVSEDEYNQNIDTWVDPDEAYTSGTNNLSLYDYEGILEYLSNIPAEPDYRFVVTPDETSHTLEIGQALDINCSLYDGEVLVEDWEGPQLYIEDCETACPISYEGWTKTWAGKYCLSIEAVSVGTANLTISDNVSGDAVNISVEVIPIDETEFEDPSMADWITKHIQYANSEAYQEQVVDGFSGKLNTAFVEVRDDWTIGSYNTLNKVNTLLDFNFSELNETQEYELLLTQILFSRNGVTSIEDMYAGYLSENALSIIKLLLKTDTFIAGLDKEKVDELKETAETLENLATGSTDFKTELTKFLNDLNSTNGTIPTDSFNTLAKSGISFIAGLTSKQLEEYCSSTKNAVMYLAAGEAYLDTSDAFSEMLLQIRSHIDIPSDLVTLKSPRVTQKDLMVMLDREMTGYRGDILVNPFDVPASIGELSDAIENFYVQLEAYKDDGGKLIAENALDQYIQGTVENVFSTGADVVLSFFEKVPVVAAFDCIKKLFNGTEFVIKTFTGIDERAYHGTMLMRLYCIERIHYITVNNMAEQTESWGQTSIIEINGVTNRDRQYHMATAFDEAVAVYRAIRAVATEYGKAYYAEPLLSIPKSYYGGWHIINPNIHALDSEQKLLNYEWCHETLEDYIAREQIRILPSEDLLIYGLKCPIDISVTNEDGAVVAELRDNQWDVAAGYEPYFCITEMSENTLKTIAVPTTFTVSISGNDTGEMDAIIIDSQSDEVRYYIDVPVTTTTSGQFTNSSDGSNLKDLIIDGSEIAYVSEVHAHAYGSPVFTWNNDYSCTATFECDQYDDSQSISCVVTRNDNNEERRIEYTAYVKFEGQTYTDTLIVPLSIARISGSGRCETAIEIADMMKETLGIESFDAIIVANGDNFADALAGSYLAAQKNAPILLYRASAVEMNLEYIQKNLSEKGIVYLLGGSSAVPADVENGLKAAGLTVRRLSGKGRFDTNLEILKEAGIKAGQEILIATGYNFADSLSASATGLPILMVNNGLGKLTEAQITFLESLEDCTFTIIGGNSAVSESLKEAIGEYGEVTRLSGKNREATSVLVAESYFESPDRVVLAYSRNFPDGLCGGPLAYALGAPLILTNAGQESVAAGYIAENDIANGLVLGGTSAVSETTVNAVFGLDK